MDASGAGATTVGLVATILDHSPVISVQGRAAKRGLIPRLPPGDRLLADVAAWLAAAYPDQARILDPAGLRVAFHPAAPPATIAADDEGAVRVEASTAEAGPGYHRFLGRLLQRLATELDIEWGGPGIEAAVADRPDVERAYLAWLGPALARARAQWRHDGSGVQLGLPRGTRFRFDGAIATALGPRDDAWLDAAIADPRVAIDITPWWSDATDGRYLVNRALTLLWLEVRWRRPALDGEGEVLDEVHRLLAKAYPVEPGLDYPWHAWAEVVALRGIEDGMTRQVFERTGGRPAEGSPIGYRRHPVVVTHAGWTLEVPGAFGERRTEEEWWGGGAGRRVTLAATPTGTMPAASFLAQVAADLGEDALGHRDGEVLGRARLSSDASSGLEVGVLDAFSAVTGSGAALRILFDDPADWRWAVDLWRSLRPA